LLRELRCTPTAAQSLDEQNARFEAALCNLNTIALVFEQRGLPGNYLKIGIDAVLVARVEESERLLSRSGGIRLLARFDLKMRCRSRSNQGDHCAPFR
jgi:hypothetical protein